MVGASVLIDTNLPSSEQQNIDVDKCDCNAIFTRNKALDCFV
jgi:hypothetical protein